MTVGERIRQRRKELDLTQEELGKLLGWGKSAVCRVEKEGNNITTDRISKIAKVLDCSPSYLMGWDEEETLQRTADLYVNMQLFEIYEKLGWEPFHLIDILDNLPKEGQKELMDFSDYLSAKYSIHDKVNTYDDIEERYRTQLHVSD